MAQGQTVQGLAPGDVIQDTYRISRLLGEGGMGATFSGENITTGHKVAIKVMSAEFARNAKAAELFKRESQLLRTVQSDAVARYETTLRDSAGRLFLVMEYVQGRSLAEYITKGARLDPLDVAKLGLRLATGLAAIHQLNIVHRDIAPDNIQVPDDNIMGAKLIDFGLASDTIGTEKSIIGDSVAGKFSFMAPEQMGMFGGKATAATDVYALALVLLRIAGQPIPGEGMGVGALEARRKDISVSNTGLPAPLNKVLGAMLRADPAKRSVDIVPLFRAAIDSLQKHTGKTKVGTDHPLDTPQKGNVIKWAIGGVLVCLVAAGVLFQLIEGAKPPPASLTNKDLAQGVLAGNDPIGAASGLVAQGGAQNLDVAFAVLKSMSIDRDLPVATRISALLGVAQMYDPLTHSKASSPFPEPDAATARREYQRAADLGSDEALRAVQRLENKN